MSDKIKVISQYNGRCGIDNADLHISRRWPARGSHVMFDIFILKIQILKKNWVLKKKMQLFQQLFT